MIKVLMVGADGQMGQCFKTLSSTINQIDFLFTGKQALDILDIDQLNIIFNREKPNFVVNCAAYTAVDLAEDNETVAQQINEIGAQNLALACKKYNATLIHLSTDFVFEGNVVKLLNETDFVKPKSVYGATKLAGERAIQLALDKHIIIRTSWLYSEYGNNFLKTMLYLSKSKSELNIIADQIGTPTYAMDLANAIMHIIQSDKPTYGVFHYSNEGVTSWYDFAVAIFKMADIKIAVNPIPSIAYPTKATRPSFSVMDKSKIKQTFDLKIQHWIESLEVCMRRLKSNI